MKNKLFDLLFRLFKNEFTARVLLSNSKEELVEIKIIADKIAAKDKCRSGSNLA